MKLGATSALTAVFLTWSQISSALCHKPWERLPQTGSEIIRPLSLALIGASTAPPLVLGPTGVDYEMRIFAQTDLGGSYKPEPVSLWAPYVIAGSTVVLYIGGALTEACPVQRQTSAMIQGIAAAAVVVGLTKFATGRRWPNGGRNPEASDRLQHPGDAKDYRPFSRGINAAFPSGHTAIMFAAAAAFRASAPSGSWWRFIGYPFAAGVGFAMWWGDHHWASDVFSGALIGEAIGGSAGRAWGPGAFGSNHPREVRVNWMVLPVTEGIAVHATGEF